MYMSVYLRLVKPRIPLFYFEAFPSRSSIRRVSQHRITSNFAICKFAAPAAKTFPRAG